MSEYMPYAVTWRKSSYSGASNDCVEVADVGLRTVVRDSKAPRSAKLVFRNDRWQAFVATARTP